LLSSSLRLYPRGQNRFRNGKFLALQGNDQEAIEIFDKALSINANHVDVLYNKGEVLDELGETEEAQRYYDKAL
jgi:tetratricopeptide (TPR) repeat protein